MNAEAMAAENARLREALQQLLSALVSQYADLSGPMYDARAALSGANNAE